MPTQKPPRIPLPKGWVGKHGSIAVVERAIRTLKNGCTRRILVPQRQREFIRELLSFQDWYNEHRPHMTLEGSTPNEVYFGRCPANRLPRVVQFIYETNTFCPKRAGIEVFKDARKPQLHRSPVRTR